MRRKGDNNKNLMGTEIEKVSTHSSGTRPPSERTIAVFPADDGPHTHTLSSPPSSLRRAPAIDMSSRSISVRSAIATRACRKVMAADSAIGWCRLATASACSITSLVR